VTTRKVILRDRRTGAQTVVTASIYGARKRPPRETVAPPRCAAVIPCRNHGRFLGQCLDSILAQDRPFDEIVVVDDGSTDETAEVARARAPRVRLIQGDWGHVASARNAGVERTTAPLIAFCDADNWVARDWLRSCLRLLDAPNVAIAHHACWQTDESGVVQRTAPYYRAFDHDALRRQNFIDTCSLVRREALMQVGGWSTAVKAMDDWTMWLKITSRGWTARTDPRPAFYYRVHGQSLSLGRARPPHCVERAEVMREAFHLAVVTPFAGRSWALPHYLRGLRSIGWPEDRCHGLFIDNGRDAKFSRLLRTKLLETCERWASLRFVRDQGQAAPGATNAAVGASPQLRLRHPDLGATFSRLYAQEAARLLGDLPDLVLTIEDDVVAIGDRIAERLLAQLDPDVMAVSGVVNSRFETLRGAAAPIAYDIDQEEPYRHHLVEPGHGIQAIGGTGVGCLLSRAEVWRRLMPLRSSVNGTGDHAWHDVALAADVRRAGFRWLIDWSARTRHYSSPTKWV